jgi:hypothetical protein
LLTTLAPAQSFHTVNEVVMTAYVSMSGVLYLLLLLAHIARVVSEGPSVARSPMFAVTTLLAAVMTAWSWRLFRRVRSGADG